MEEQKGCEENYLKNRLIPSLKYIISTQHIITFFKIVGVVIFAVVLCYVVVYWLVFSIGLLITLPIFGLVLIIVPISTFFIVWDYKDWKDIRKLKGEKCESNTT